MTTQYGFLSIPAAVLAVKPANWRAKILKILAGSQFPPYL